MSDKYWALFPFSRIEERAEIFHELGIQGGDLKVLNSDPGKSNLSIVYLDANPLIRGWKE